MNWILVAVAFLALVWFFGAGRTRAKRAPNILNNQGLPKPTTRGDFRQKDEE